MPLIAEKHQSIINDYRAAYRAANGFDAPHLKYEGGWVYIPSGQGTLATRYRLKDIQEMTNRLLARAASMRTGHVMQVAK